MECDRRSAAAPVPVLRLPLVADAALARPHVDGPVPGQHVVHDLYRRYHAAGVLVAVGHGLVGIAWAWALVAPIVNIPQFIYAFRTIEIRVWDWLDALWPALAGCIAMSIAIVGLRWALPATVPLAAKFACRLPWARSCTSQWSGSVSGHARSALSNWQKRCGVAGGPSLPWWPPRRS